MWRCAECPPVPEGVRRVADLLGRRWTLAVLYASHTGARRFNQFVAARGCVNPGGGSTDYCMHHSGDVLSWIGQTSINYDFHDSEGCADYLAVFTAPSAVTLTPNISVTYNPASKPTGVCA